MALIDWTYKNNRFFHIPCKSYAYPERIYQSNTIKCDKCKGSLPEELEFPSIVFGADKQLKWLYESTYFYVDINSTFKINSISFHQSSNPGHQKEE